jgi:hypothetical protein
MRKCYNQTSISALCYNQTSKLKLCYNQTSKMKLCYNQTSKIKKCYNHNHLRHLLQSIVRWAHILPRFRADPTSS